VLGLGARVAGQLFVVVCVFGKVEERSLGANEGKECVAYIAHPEPECGELGRRLGPPDVASLRMGWSVRRWADVIYMWWEWRWISFPGCEGRGPTVIHCLETSSRGLSSPSESSSCVVSIARSDTPGTQAVSSPPRRAPSTLPSREDSIVASRPFPARTEGAMEGTGRRSLHAYVRMHHDPTQRCEPSVRLSPKLGHPCSHSELGRRLFHQR
jgi:hypothetical protein